MRTVLERARPRIVLRPWR